MTHEPPEELFRIALEAAPTGMLMIDASGAIVLVNAQIEQSFGYRREELIGREVEVLLPERFRARHAGLRAEFLLKPGVRAMGAGRDLFGLRKDGSEFAIEIGLNPRTIDGRAFVLCSVSDITARLAARREREELIARLARLRVEQTFRAAFDQSPIATAILRADLTFSHVNAAWVRLLGYERHELVEMKPADLTHPDDLAEDEPLVAALCRGDIQAYSRDERYLRRDGSSVHVAVHAAAMQDADGNRCYIGQVQDITARLRAEQALRQQALALESERERFRTLVANAPVGIFELDADGSMTYVNDRFLEITGLSAEQARDPVLRAQGVHPGDHPDCSRPGPRRGARVTATSRSSAIEPRAGVSSACPLLRHRCVLRTAPCPASSGSRRTLPLSGKPSKP
jgi:PAS domain S-box-containing protein